MEIGDTAGLETCATLHPDGKFPRPIAFNVIPQVGGFDAEGNSVEENKVEAEIKNRELIKQELCGRIVSVRGELVEP